VYLLLLNFAGAGTIGKRFDKISLENAEENRRNYRQLLFQAGPEMAKYISGVIMFHETFFQKSSDGTPLVKILQDLGVIPGIKVDTGTVTLAGTDDEFTTQGRLIFMLLPTIGCGGIMYSICPAVLPAVHLCINAYFA